MDRSHRERAIENTHRAAEKLWSGRSFIVYPEGTRSPDGRLRPFNKVGFYMALEVGVPIVPVTIDGTHRIMPKGPIRVVPGTVRVTVHPPIDVIDCESADIDTLIRRVWEAIASALPRFPDNRRAKTLTPIAS